MASVRAASLSRVSLLDVGIINAYVLWMMANRPLPANQRLFGLKQFKLKLVHDLCCVMVTYPAFFECLLPSTTLSSSELSLMTLWSEESLPTVFTPQAQNARRWPGREQLRLHDMQGVPVQRGRMLSRIPCTLKLLGLL